MTSNIKTLRHDDVPESMHFRTNRFGLHISLRGVGDDALVFTLYFNHVGDATMATGWEECGKGPYAAGYAEELGMLLTTFNEMLKAHPKFEEAGTQHINETILEWKVANKIPQVITSSHLRKRNP